MAYLILHEYFILCIISKCSMCQVRTQEKNSGGSRLWPPYRGSGGQSPPGRRRIFENLKINFLRKMQKFIILAYFAKYLTRHALLFRAF